jgi:7-keto-8-aminopelargonate synthetase-like enzyme
MQKLLRNWGLAYPMGARMMSGNSVHHEQLEAELAAFENKEDAILLNFGYQGIMSTIDAICGRHDVIVYDAESHACIIDGFVYILDIDMFLNTMIWKILKSKCKEQLH